MAPPTCSATAPSVPQRWSPARRSSGSRCSTGRTLRFEAPLAVTAGVIAVRQPPASLAALAGAVGALRGFHLTALSQLVQATGSLVIGLAVAHRRLDAAEAFAAAQLDETWQLETWGEDAQALERRRKLAADIEAAAQPALATGAQPLGPVGGPC